MLANFQIWRLLVPTVPKRSPTKIWKSPVHAAVANIASTRTRSAAGSSDVKFRKRATQERAHDRETGDLEQIRRPTTWETLRAELSEDQEEFEVRKYHQEQAFQQSPAGMDVAGVPSALRSRTSSGR